MKRKAPVAGKVLKVHAEAYSKRSFTQEFLLSNGKRVQYLLWESFKVPAVVFPITKKGEVVVLNQFRFGANEFVLELPGGCRDLSESITDTVRRELFEETGYIAKNVVALGPRMWLDPSQMRVFFYPFLATGCSRARNPKPDAEEIADVHAIPLRRWPGMVRDGKIVDSKSLAITFLAASRLGLMKGLFR